MKKELTISSSIVVALALALGALFVPSTARAQKISKQAKAGAYSVTLKVLPAESFKGPNAAMARDGGAQPNQIKGPEHPNHHLVVFVKLGGKPVEDANVSISYRELSPNQGAWLELSVVRMHEAGKSLRTTHYGNNVKLSPGSYEARVTVNGGPSADFHFKLKH
ncbi:MAG TPA: hypothetical protein VKA67_13125 [Verrucomicrobiae bacterium]|nr:hypothetical protein [Verrucomicrobiae bacterium]